MPELHTCDDWPHPMLTPLGALLLVGATWVMEEAEEIQIWGDFNTAAHHLSVVMPAPGLGEGECSYAPLAGLERET